MNTERPFTPEGRLAPRKRSVSQVNGLEEGMSALVQRAWRRDNISVLYLAVRRDLFLASRERERAAKARREQANTRKPAAPTPRQERRSDIPSPVASRIESPPPRPSSPAWIRFLQGSLRVSMLPLAALGLIFDGVDFMVDTITTATKDGIRYSITALKEQNFRVDDQARPIDELVSPASLHVAPQAALVDEEPLAPVTVLAESEEDDAIAPRDRTLIEDERVDTSTESEAVADDQVLGRQRRHQFPGR